MAGRWYPILFTGAMVRAILAGVKTETRRVVVPQPPPMFGKIEKGLDSESMSHWKLWGHDGGDWRRRCPYGMEEDFLWVRENCYIAPPNFGYDGDANCRDDQGRPRIVSWSASMDTESVRCARDYGVKQTPSILMWRWASRLSLKNMDVNLERAQEIDGVACFREGVLTGEGADPHGYYDDHAARVRFAQVWDSINAKRGYPWDKNPWVWRIKFERLP